jgi:glycerol uptake facilitator protein
MFQIGAVWALGATLAIYCTAAISGGHLNPAVTLAFCLVRRDDFPIRNVLPYWMAQLVGSMLAAGINLTMFHVAIKRYERKHGIVRGSEESIASAAGAFGNYWSLNKGVSGNFHAFFMEAFATAFLCFIIFAATHAKNPLPSAAVAPVVGTAFGMMVCIFGGLTGAALNPARDLGPRLVTLMAKWGTVSMTNSVVYIVGPLVGGPVGAFCADKILMID